MNPVSFMAFQKKNDRFYESPWNLTSDPPQSCRTTFFGWGPERFDFSKFIWIGNSAQDWTSTALKIVELKKIGNSNLRNFGQNPLMLVLQMPIAHAPMANGWNPLPAHISLCHCTLWSIYRLLYISFAGFQPSISWFQKWFVFFSISRCDQDGQRLSTPGSQELHPRRSPKCYNNPPREAP